MPPHPSIFYQSQAAIGAQQPQAGTSLNKTYRYIFCSSCEFWPLTECYMYSLRLGMQIPTWDTLDIAAHSYSSESLA